MPDIDLKGFRRTGFIESLRVPEFGGPRTSSPSGFGGRPDRGRAPRSNKALAHSINVVYDGCLASSSSVVSQTSK
ncbi:hypothetical protein PsorP6_000551 [Peronosclerospora sorghi]|uniref:Uncharacterized protein n=1 Tax=Peronosclerospora sorghi TaxID=230839 RepID=A0ACC0WW56_9STRA|nr:hypothetical protein PsorP6_000551 [Peronosclerospora sorghi]